MDIGQGGDHMLRLCVPHDWLRTLRLFNYISGFAQMTDVLCDASKRNRTVLEKVFVNSDQDSDPLR